MRAMIVICGAALCMGMLALVGASPRAEPTALPARAEPDGLEHELQQLHARTAALSAELAALRQRPTAAQAAAAHSIAEEVTHLGAVPPAPSEEPPSEEQLEAEHAREAERYREHLDAELARQPVDRDWSAATSLPERLRAVLPEGSSLESIDCGTSLCRVITSHRDSDGYRSFQREGFMRPDPAQPTLWSGAATFMELAPPASDPSRVLASVYLSRDQTLPAR